MKTPICKLCGKAHWSYDPHADVEPSVPEYVRDMAKGAMGLETRADWAKAPAAQLVPTKVPTQLVGVPTCECGKPCEGRYRKCAACRKRAYRERSK